MDGTRHVQCDENAHYEVPWDTHAPSPAVDHYPESYARHHNNELIIGVTRHNFELGYDFLSNLICQLFSPPSSFVLVLEFVQLIPSS